MHSMPCIVMNCILYTGMIADWRKTSTVVRSSACESRRTNANNTVFILMHTEV